jgi:hypothetical protein
MSRLKSGYASKKFESGRKEYRRISGYAQPVQEGKEETENRIPLDTTGYFFVSEFTKPDYKKPTYMVLPKFGSSLKNGANKNNIKLTSPRFYDVTFFADELVTQLADNSIINTYYQPISAAGAQLFNPGLNGLFELGMVDLFEDYRFVGGLRISYDLSGLDYFVSFETLKKRLDHKFQFYRQSRAGNSPEGFSARSLSHELRYITKYPISQTSSFRLNIFGRQVSAGGTGGTDTGSPVTMNFGVGATTANTSNGSSATANTGSGGNAGKTLTTTNQTGGAGGSGLVVLRYVV